MCHDKVSLDAPLANAFGQPSQPANAVDAKMFWTALYAYPAGWVALLFV